mmetsp:Transcript_30995/g.62954  ORF Transcript_30995/g.62954 Transcript_30995/m.62954 type:complete len:517 (+) Transcript_30995:451-2001(+)
MPPKGHDTPPTSPCRELVLAELTGAPSRSAPPPLSIGTGTLPAVSADDVRPASAVDHNNNSSNSSSRGGPIHAAAPATILTGGRGRRRSSLSLTAAVAVLDDVGEEEMMVVPMGTGSGRAHPLAAHHHEARTISRTDDRISTSVSLHRYRAASPITGMGVDDDEISVEMDDRKPPSSFSSSSSSPTSPSSCAAASNATVRRPSSSATAGGGGLPPLPCTPTSCAAAAAAAASVSSETTPELPANFVSPPPSAQCRRPRRSSLKKPEKPPQDEDGDVVGKASVDDKCSQRGEDDDDDDNGDGEGRKIPCTCSADSADSSSSSSSVLFKKLERNLSFHSVEIRPYSQVLGDHPCCSAGPPISLGWEYDPNAVTVQQVDEYETNREPRRSRKDMKLDCEERKKILSSVTVPASTADGCATETTAYTSQDFRRAERRLYRERRVSSRKMNHFFGVSTCALGVDESAATCSDVATAVESNTDTDTAGTQSISATATTVSGKQRRLALYAQDDTGVISPHHE